MFETLKNFIKIHELNDDAVVRFGLARVINNISETTNDVDLYVNEKSFLKLKEFYPDCVEYVPECYNFKSTYKITIDENKFIFEIFLDSNIEIIEKYKFDGVYVTTIKQTIIDYKNLGKREGKYNV